ncbi:MAG: hypothetical protein NTU80_00935 [Verrucomicrobia bacterium]|nr:hypothetical protein [Verrucomicrobiota bacterium]
MSGKQMHIIKILRDQNDEIVNTLLEELHKHAPKCAIQIPYDLDSYRLGGKGDLLQFLLTWSRNCPDAPIYTHIQPNVSDEAAKTQLARLFSQEHGFILALFTRAYGVESPRAFLKTTGAKIDDQIIHEALSSTTAFARGKPITKGTRAFLAIDDLLDQENKALREFCRVYEKRKLGTHLMKTEFKALLDDVFERPRSIHRRFWSKYQPPPDNFTEKVSAIAYELFENADRWGKPPYSRSIRGILLHLHYRESEGKRPLVAEVGINSPLKDYLSTFQGEDGYESTPFLEFSVFDNGIGLATQFKNGKPPRSIKTEFNETISCLLFSSGSSSKASEGKGLYESMLLLNRAKGFLRYRSGRLDIYRDFRKAPIHEPELRSLEFAPPEERQQAMRDILCLEDWENRSRKITENHKTIGALFTMIIPIGGLRQ